jgi:hypothetical protein
MSDSIEKMVQQFAEGGLGPEAQSEFDRRFEADPQFSEKAVKALGERLGAAPEEFLDRVVRKARPGLEEIWKLHAPKAPLPTAALPSPVAAALSTYGPQVIFVGAVILLAGMGVYVVRENGRGPRPVSPPPQAAPAVVPEVAPDSYTGLESEPVMRVTMVSKASKGSMAPGSAVRVGTAIRIQGIPSDTSVVIDVVDAHGMTVRRLYQGIWAKDQVLDWDGLDGMGRPVASGAYRARVKTSSKTYTSEFTVQ